MTCFTNIWNNSSRHDFFEFIYFVTDGSFTADGGLSVTDGVCKDNTSNDMFSWCKSVQNMATGKSDDQLIQPDNKLKIGTRSGKLRIGHDCVVTMHDAYTNDNMTTSTDFHND